MIVRYLQGGIGVLVLVALAVVFWPGGEAAKREAEAVEVQVEEVAPTGGAENPKPTGAGEPTKPVLESKPLVGHGVGQLGGFVLPLVEGREVSLEVAVNGLMTAYRDACRRTRAVPLALEFSFPDENDGKISFSIERGDFMTVLRRIAGLAGYRTAFDGLEISFSELPKGGELEGRTFAVPPVFRASLEGELKRLGISHGPLIGDLLLAGGILQTERRVELSEDGVLSATASAAEFERLEARIAATNQVQIKAGVRIIQSEEALVGEVEGMTPGQLTELLLSIAGKEGVKMTTMPSVTAREQQAADIEVIRKYPGGWTGLRINLEAERMGLAILTRDVVEYRPEDHPKPYAQNTTYGVFSDGEPQLSLVAKRDGTFIYRVLTVELIDASGRPLRSPEGAGTDGYAVAKPVPDAPGMVFSPYNGKVVDVRDIPAGTLVADPTYPPSEKKFFRVP